MKLIAQLDLTNETVELIKKNSSFDLTDQEIQQQLTKFYQEELSDPKKLVQVLDELDFWNY